MGRHRPFYTSNMYKPSKPSVFSQMNKPPARVDSGGYRSWKQKDQVPEKKELNPASFTEFPDLVKAAPKKTVFEGTSLASKLKEVIAAEEEAAIQKRLKKGETPDQILREMCVVLPLKGRTNASQQPLEIPWWVTDESKLIVIPPFRHKSLVQISNERRLKRLGVNPRDIYVFDEPQDDMDDTVSLPSLSEHSIEPEEEEVPQEEFALQ
jgi:hypothetical protein